ncbi:MAG: NAD-binding protein, partial [Candidatus Accumulibacter sp.]|nr:NAD-binding protein [Accumulibacter sp.]
PLSQVNIFVKDLGIVLDYARKAVFPLPLAAAAHQMFLSASAAGHGAEDDSAVIKVFPGIELPGAKD